MGDPIADRLLPTYDIESRHHITIQAPAEAAYSAARTFDLAESKLVALLFQLRGLPPSALTLDGLAQLRFKPLIEEPPDGFALGLIGQFWRPSGRLLDFDPSAFGEAAPPGFAKAVWSFWTQTHDPATCTLHTSTRVMCADASARRSFLRYWRLVGPFSGLIRRRALRLIRVSAERTQWG